jgi:hypothetical protein
MSVVVHDLNISRAIRRPEKADTGLSVDSDADLTQSIPHQGLEPVARRSRKIAAAMCLVQHVQLSSCPWKEIRWTDPASARRTGPVEQILCALVGEGENHRLLRVSLHDDSGAAGR